MNLAKGLLQQVEAAWGAEKLRHIRVTRVCVGLHWTLVESACAGLSHTYRGDRSQCVTNAGGLTGVPAWELAQRVLSGNTLDASLGWAALKSLMCDGKVGQQSASTDVRSWVRQHGQGRRVSVIGRFPFAQSLGQGVGALYRFEMEPEEGELPAWQEAEVVPLCHINVITATSLINGTLDSLLQWGKRGANLLVGPTTPMHPWLLSQGVDMMCWVEVVDPDALFRCVGEGVPGLRQMEGVRPVVMMGPELSHKVASWRME